MSLTLSLRGTLVGKPEPLAENLPFKVKAHEKVRLGAQRDATATVQKLVVAPDDAVCVRLADGFEWWLRADEAAREFGVGGKRSARGKAIIEIDPAAVLAAAVARSAHTARDGRRDGVDIALDSLELVGIDLAGKSAQAIGEWAENKALDAGGPGLYRVAIGGTEMTLEPVTAVGGKNAAGPVLIFIHGTGSSSRGSFSELWDPKNQAGVEARKQFANIYGERVYALEHRSLTQSPIANALALALLLPKDADVHLVTHSRGGLVGDLICLGQRQGKALTAHVLDELFARDRTMAEQWGLGPRNADGYPAQRQTLDKLLTELDAKRPRVTRYVRAACPALGTTLASGKLDRWLSVLRFVGGGIVAESLIAFLLAVIKERTDPRSLPGLESMMPGSALVRMLNLDALRVDADLSVIAGDVEGDSIWGRLKLALPDWFFAGDHDLVVNTGSMYGGARRLKPARYFFDQGAEVCHFNYFRNPKTVGQLAAGLIDPLHPPADFKPLEESQREEPARAAPLARKPAGSAPYAILLPGIMGSHLSEGGERVWFDLGRMAAGGIERLKIDRPGVTASDVFGDFYSDFTDFLQASHSVDVFPFDWRISIRDSANALATLVEQRLADAERNGQGLHIVAHSMGGLVARAMLALRPDLWRRLKSLPAPACFRLIMLGTPNHGSFQAVRLMVGQYGIADLVALLDYRHSRWELMDIFNRYPGAAELLPWADSGRDFADPMLWRALRAEAGENWPLPDKAALRTARDTWALLRDAPADGECMAYVAGWSGRTACDYVIEQNSGETGYPARRIVFQSTRRGDGTVPWDLGRLAGVPTWYAEGVAHDQLLAHKPAFAAYLDLLLTGGTDRLPSAEPAGVRGLAPADDLQAMPPDLPPHYPRARDFGGFGGFAQRPTAAVARSSLPLIRVSISHGDLAYARYPVCVGHYQGDTQVSAEQRLDSGLGGALSDRLRLDIYPGRLGTWEIFIAPTESSKPAGALVIGLGQVGELSPGALSAAMSHVLLDYALQVATWNDDRFGTQGTIRKARISSLLIGTGAGGFTVRDSVTTILLAVKTANERLAELTPPARVCIDEVELLEIFEDIAVQAAHALAHAIAAGNLAESFVWPERAVQGGTAGLRRSVRADAPGWWRRLEITHERDRDLLRFVMLTDRARAEHSLVAGQIKLADRFIADVIGGTTCDGDLSRTLYEMLIPNPLKELAPDRRDTVLLLDEESARFPWELLDDRWTDAGPLSIAAGLLRQLKTTEYRAKPLQTRNNSAFVVGNPLVGGDFIDLPGARDEAQAVTAALRADGFRVHSAINQGSAEIMRGLHGDAYRILHLAGHGVHDYELKDDAPPRECDACQQALPVSRKFKSGMLIGPGTVLTPGDVEQIRWVPELVFINCCHLGVTLTNGYSSHGKLAANLAVQFIRMGVKAVVAAGWAVDDAAASAFAVSFYGAMNRGVTFGRAVLEARQQIRQTYPQCNTWGAYQCYGDPHYRLSEDGAERSDDRSPYFSPQELVADLDNLTSRASVDSIKAEQIESLLTRIPQEHKDNWLGAAAVATALGLAWGQIERFDAAIACLDTAARNDESAVPIKALELRANYKARHAAILAQQGRQSDAIELFKEAYQELSTLLSIGPTVERHSLMASLWKRVALAMPDNSKDALGMMREQYQLATELCEGNASDDTYARTNTLLAEVLIAMLEKPLTKRRKEEIVRECGQLAASSHSRNHSTPKFWTGAAEPGALFVAALAAGTLHTERGTLLKLYRSAIGRGASRGDKASVLDQYRFVERVLSERPRCASARKTVSEMLRELTIVSGN
jgi:pimeloyl-ACP methyl ester carboxylesterase